MRIDPVARGFGDQRRQKRIVVAGDERDVLRYPQPALGEHTGGREVSVGIAHHEGGGRILLVKESTQGARDGIDVVAVISDHGGGVAVRRPTHAFDKSALAVHIAGPPGFAVEQCEAAVSGAQEDPGGVPANRAVIQIIVG